MRDEVIGAAVEQVTVAVLDALTRDDMNLVLMKMWAEQHRTAIFVTHSIREAVYLSDRVLVMSQRPGRIVADVRIPFRRPRNLEIGETTSFNEICGLLRIRTGEKFGLVYSIPDYHRDYYLSILVNLPFINGDKNWRLPVPATYVIAKDGKVVHAEAYADFRVRPEPADIFKAIDQLD